MDRNISIASLRKLFEWLRNKCLCKQSRNSQGCSNSGHQVDSNTPLFERSVNTSSNRKGTATKAQTSDNPPENNYTPTTKVFKSVSGNGNNTSMHPNKPAAPTITQANIDCANTNIATDQAAEATNRKTKLKPPKRCNLTRPPLPPAFKSISIKKSTVDYKHMEHQDVASTRTYGSVSTVTMDPAIRMESSINSETMRILQSNRSIPVMPLPSFQRETILSFSSAIHESSQYDWANGNHTIFTMDDSIWSACRNYDNTPVQNHTSSASQFNISWHNIYQRNYYAEPPLSEVAPRQLVEI